MRRLRPTRTALALLALALLALALLPVARPTPAWACSCAGLPVAEQYDRADAVFVGRVQESRASGAKASYVFAVDRVLKGEVHEQQGVVSHASGATCGLELQGGGPFVVFGRRTASPPLPGPGSGQYVAGLCDGTAPVSAELTAQVQALAGAPAQAPQPGSAGLPGPTWTRWLLPAGALAAGLAALLAVRRRRTL